MEGKKEKTNKIYEKCADVNLKLKSGSTPLLPLMVSSFFVMSHLPSLFVSSDFSIHHIKLVIFSSLFLSPSLVHTEVSDCSRITNLWLLGSMNSSPKFRKGSDVTVTTRAKSSRRSEKTWPWRRADVTGSSLTSVHWRPLPFSRWYCRVGPVVRYRSRNAWREETHREGERETEERCGMERQRGFGKLVQISYKATVNHICG